MILLILISKLKSDRSNCLANATELTLNCGKMFGAWLTKSPGVMDMFDFSTFGEESWKMSKFLNIANLTVVFFTKLKLLTYKSYLKLGSKTLLLMPTNED